jgi:DNA helicase II / ATP-dependent DNA helicase PcrA
MSQAHSTPAREWSPFQDAVFDAIQDDNAGHIVVSAVPGSGKTTTLEHGIKHYTFDGAKILVCAFNKDIAAELNNRIRIAGCKIQTLHGFGLSVVTRNHGHRVIDTAGNRMNDELKSRIGKEWDKREARTFVSKVISIGKSCLVGDADTLDELADKHGYECPKNADRSTLIAHAQAILAANATQTDGLLSFDDMVWLPVIQRLGMPKFDLVFVDETQDLNPCQLKLIRLAAGTNGRIIAVGDMNQCIYGFRGADTDGMPRMVRELKATQFPLSICYRCDAAIVREAADVHPGILARPNAPEGIVRDATEAECMQGARKGDYIISRTNAPLISMAFKFLANGIPCSIRGRDIGEGLAAWVKKEKCRDVPHLVTQVQTWCSEEIKRLTALERPIDLIVDKAECLIALCEGMNSIDDVLNRINVLFADGASGGIQLMSTHKAKGLETDRVWLLIDTYCKWPGKEEENLLYVGITRARHELIYVSKEKEGT